MSDGLTDAANSARWRESEDAFLQALLRHVQSPDDASFATALKLYPPWFPPRPLRRGTENETAAAHREALAKISREDTAVWAAILVQTLRHGHLGLYRQLKPFSPFRGKLLALEVVMGQHQRISADADIKDLSGSNPFHDSEYNRDGEFLLVFSLPSFEQAIKLEEL